jgi:hypothetical protein
LADGGVELEPLRKLTIDYDRSHTVCQESYEELCGWVPAAGARRVAEEAIENVQEERDGDAVIGGREVCGEGDGVHIVLGDIVQCR